MFFQHTASPVTPIYIVNVIISGLATAIVYFLAQPEAWREFLLSAIRPSAEALQEEKLETEAWLETLGHE